MASGRWRPASFKSTGRTRVAGNVAEMSQGRQGTLSQRDGVGGGREMEGREEEGGEIWRRVASALKRPFGHPFRGLSGTFPVLVRYLSGASYGLSGTFASAVLWQGARSGPQSREKTGTTHNMRIESFTRVARTVIFAMCGFSPCPLNPEE